MIQELLDLSVRLNLSGHAAFALRNVHWLIDLDAKGQILGVVPTVAATSPGSGRQGQDRGLPIECPVAFFAAVRKSGVATAGGGGKSVAEPGKGTVAEVFGAQIESLPGVSHRVLPLPKSDAYKHFNFVNLHRQLAESAPHNKTLQAVWRFFCANDDFPVGEFTERQLAALAAQQFSFRVAGQLLLTDPDLRRWWQLEFDRRRAEVVARLAPGRDLFPWMSGDPCTGRLTTVFPHISGVPGGGAWCPLASFDKPAYRSFGLGRGTLPMRLETAERASAALNWLLRDESSHLRLGNTVAVFWARSARGEGLSARDIGFSELMSTPDPLEVRKFLLGGWGSRPRDIDDGRFYAAVLSSPKARISVRMWHTATLSRVRENLQRWFAVIAMPATFGSGEMYPSLEELAASTVRNSRDVRPPPGTYAALFESALGGMIRLPKSLLARALVRQAAELAIETDGVSRAEFERRLAARTALFQVFLHSSPGAAMPLEPVELETNVAFICGRLLAHLDRIHRTAYQLFEGRDASAAIRAYAAASATPALIFPQLCRLARFQLRKIGGSLAYWLEFGTQDAPTTGLCGIFESLRSAGSEFPRTLSLEDQGRFAIGFYTERRRRWAKDREATADPTSDAASDPTSDPNSAAATAINEPQTSG